MGRGREGPKKFLAQYGGILQTDGYTVYDSEGGANIVRAACWAHARRKFVEALKLNPQDVAAARIAVSINGLFAVDTLARELSLEQRHQLRGEKSAPLLASLHEELKKLQYQVLPTSALGRAAAYTLRLWPKLIRFLDHPELELSKNFAENSMRGVALGRKNWIHIGSENAGPKVAAILSVVESCKRLGVAARSYLAELLPGLKDLKIQEIATRTPASWVNSRSKA